MTGQKLSMWTIYDHPSDYPDCWIARRHDIDRVGSQPTVQTIIAGDIETLRRHFRRAGMVCVTRDPSDDSKIVETWM